MHGLIGLVTHLATMNVKRTVARTSRNGLFIAIAAILFVTTYVFAMIAATLWLSRRYDPLIATSAIAAGTLVLGLIILVVMAIINSQEKRRQLERQIGLESALTVGLSLVRSQPMLLAAVAAALVGSSLTKRR